MNELEVQDQPPMSVKDWLITLLLTHVLPVVGLVMLFVYAFGDSKGNINRQNWAKATLIFMAIMIAIVVFFMILFGGILAAAMASRQ